MPVASAAEIIRGYRTENKWVETSKFQYDLDYGLPTLENYLNQPRFSGLKYRYYNTDGTAYYQKKYIQIPIVLILEYAQTLMRPVYTDFTEVNENEEFMPISARFYYELFVQEYIFVTYNVFERPGDYVIEPSKEGKNTMLFNAIKEKGGFDLWVKLDEDEYSQNVEFMHIDTSLVVKFPKWRTMMAWCKWGACRQNNLVNWINIAGTEIAQTDYLSQCIRICGKKLILTTQGQNEAQITQLEEMLNSFNNYIHFNLKNTSDVEPFVAFNGTDLLAIKDTTYHYLDRMKFEYGRVANTNPKGERITSGENYKDISAIANRQKETLEYLIYFAKQVKKLWGIELNFAVSGIPEKEAIYSVSHLAQTPNMHKEMFGQIEGTGNRLPIGAKGVRQVDKGARKANKNGKWRS